MLVFFWFFILIKRESFKDVFRQSKIFYTNRIQAKVVWWTGYMLWLYIIESAGVIVATLLWFFTIVFSVVTMRLILDDVPSKKQVILSFFVILMIGIWYYFK